MHCPESDRPPPHVRERKRRILLACAVVLLVSACGGGGGNGSSSAPDNKASGTNTVPLVVKQGPTGLVNLPTISLTLCVPGDATRCQRIDDVIVDTGSTGVRILAEALDPALRAALPMRNRSDGGVLTQCMQFVSGSTWGPVHGADLTIGGLTAPNAAIQVIGEPGFAAVPADCTKTGLALNTVKDFGSNGLVGVSWLEADCGLRCASDTSPSLY
jgi:hypothetical protein